MVGLAVPTPATVYEARRVKGASKSQGRGSGMEREIAQSLTTRYSDWIEEALDDLQDSFLITDPCISENPIVFASRGFLKIMGYSREEVVGRNGRIFQGPGTDRRTVLEIREAIREERSMQVNLLNYRKDGTPIWILFHLFPVFGKEDGQVIHFVAVQVPIPKKRRTSACSRAGHGGADDRGFVLGSCRWEMCAEMENRCSLAAESFVDSDNRVLEAEQLCDPSDAEKQKAIDAAYNILSALTHYSKVTGRMVSAKQCTSVRVNPVSTSLNISLGRIKQSFVLIDPHLLDMPIVYASDAFLSLTGYSRQEVLGRNCRFLNGPGTDEETLHQVTEGIRMGQGCSVRILNYRKDGIMFWNLLHVSPVRNAFGKIAFFVFVQIDESAKTDGLGLSSEIRQLGAVGAVKVAVRGCSLSGRPGASRTS